MARTRRENQLLIGAAAAIGALGLYWYVITPYLTTREEIAAQKLTAMETVNKDLALFKDERDMRKLWKDMSAAGLTAAPSEVERKMLHSMRQWAQESGLANVSLRPERTNRDFGYVKVVVHASGSGSESAVAKMLWSAESATAPVRVDDLQLTPNKEGTDDLQMQLTISMLCATGNDKLGDAAGARNVRSRGADSLVEDHQ